jgi:hypothetical protein
MHLRIGMEGAGEAAITPLRKARDDLLLSRRRSLPAESSTRLGRRFAGRADFSSSTDQPSRSRVMPADLQRHENPAARRFSQVCIVSLAALITSGTGLLAYLNQDPGPAWLRATVLASAVMVGVSFCGWLIASIAAFARDQMSSSR